MPSIVGVARTAQTLWLLGNVYEAVVDVPPLVVAARGRRRPGVLTAGSPLRYYLLIGPVAVAGGLVAAGTLWRRGHRARAVVAAAGTMKGAALTGVLVRRVNLRLLRHGRWMRIADARRATTTWQALNALRIGAVAASVLALRP